MIGKVKIQSIPLLKAGMNESFGISDVYQLSFKIHKQFKIGSITLKKKLCIVKSIISKVTK